MVARRLNLEPVPADVRDRANPFTHPLPSDDPAGPFRIGELSRLSGIAVGTIKYYLRESLIPAGRAISKTQALYGPEHLRRLRLVRVLAEVGGLSIAQVRRIVEVLDEGGEDPGELGQLVAYAIDGPTRDPGGGESAAEIRRSTDAFVDALGLVVDPSAPARASLAEALAALKTLGISDHPSVFQEHARIAYELAEFEVAMSSAVTDRATAVETATVGTVIFGAAFMALRRMAHEHVTRVRLGELGMLDDPDPDPDPEADPEADPDPAAATQGA